MGGAAVGPDAFDYALPPEQIAQTPAASRGDARLLRVGPPHAHHRVCELPALVPPGALVVVNASAVVPARLPAVQRAADGRAFELLVCDPAPGLPLGAVVRAWVRGAKRLRPGDRLECGAMALEYLGPDEIDPRARRFALRQGDILASLRDHGELPLPPYVQRDAGPTQDDRARYQTVYADLPGSVAAPTAGLHLEPPVLDALDWVALHLHVGPGTFLPMDVDDVRDHRVGRERVEIGPSTAARIEAARAQGRPILAIGTTVVRALEGVARQHGGEVRPGATSTDLVITPGFSFAVVTDLLTNFHLPRSSLLMLTCALGSRARVLQAYREAVEAGYRFYSYGDCMLVSARPEPTAANPPGDPKTPEVGDE